METVADLLNAVRTPWVHTIELAANATFVFDETIIVPFDGGANNAPTALVIERSMTIRGRSSVLDAAASADAPRRVLTVMPRVVLEMQGISLTGGYLVPGQARGAGASVAPEATLLLDDCHVYANRHVSGATGGIVVSGALCADHCTIYNNQVASDRVLSQGGGLNIDREGVANLTGTNVTGNLVTSSGTGSARGGGVFNNGRLLAVRCTIEYNKAASVGGIVQGGGLENSGQARLIETAVEHNMATSASGNLVAGAGIFNNVDATLMLERSIIKHNLGKSLERQVLGGGLNTRGDATLTDSIIAHNSAIGSLFTAGGGISSGFEGLLIITSCNITGNIVQGAETVMGGGLFHVSLRRAFLIGSLVANNSVTGGDGSGHQIFNAANLSYVMAAPLGRWLSGTVECPVAPVQCPGGDECPNQPCDVASHPWLVGRHLTSLMGGPTDSDYPPACEPGSYAVDDSIAEQSFPTCSGLCAALDPSSTTEHAGAIGQASCSCSKGFFLATATSGVCEACPAGATSCAEIGSTLASLELTPGHWRLSESTADIRDCTGGMRVGPDVRTGTGTGTAAGNTTRIITTCRGGSDSSDYCAAGLAGPLCRVCAEPDHFLDVARAACERCPATGVAALWLPALIGLLLLLLPLLWMLREYLVEAVGLWWSSSLCLVSVQQSTALVRSLGLVAIAKLLVAYFQVVAVLPEVYAVTLPPEYLEAMESLKWISLDWLSLVHVSCLGDFQDRLQISAFLPLALLALVFACGVLVTLANERACSLAAVRRGLLTGLPPTLVICFALVPSVSSRLFSAFSWCAPSSGSALFSPPLSEPPPHARLRSEAFGYDDAAGKSRSFLFVDYAVECDASDEYAALTSLATVLLLLWPIGVPLLFLVLLWSHGTAAQAARGAAEAPLSKAVAFLHREYTSSMRYCIHAQSGNTPRPPVPTAWLLYLRQPPPASRLSLGAFVPVAGHLIPSESSASFEILSIPAYSFRWLCSRRRGAARAGSQVDAHGLHAARTAAVQLASAGARAAAHGGSHGAAPPWQAVHAATHRLLRLHRRLHPRVHLPRRTAPPRARAAARRHGRSLLRRRAWHRAAGDAHLRIQPRRRGGWPGSYAWPAARGDPQAHGPAAALCQGWRTRERTATASKG